MKPRLEDVAARAGVSVATVSRVVNGKAGVSERTRRAVLAQIEQLGYERPWDAARLRSGLVGLIVPELENPVFPAFVQEIEGALAAHGYAPLLCTASPVVQEDEYLDLLLGRGVAGLLFLAGRHANTEVDHTRYHDLRGSGVPMVLIDGQLDGLDVPAVSTDDAGAVRRAVVHLRNLGHRRIGCAMGPVRYITSQRKIAGFHEGLRDRPDLPPVDDASHELVAHDVFSVEGGDAAVQGLIDRGVTAVVCGSALMALGAVRAVRGRGLAVPRDVAVVAYDDFPLLAFTDPPLTALRQPIAAMSRYAVDALVDEIKGTPHHRREAMFDAELMVRGSTGPLRTG